MEYFTMKLTSRVGVALITFGGLAAGAVAHPTFSETIGVDVWNVPALHDHIERERLAERTLHSKGETTLRRATLRHELIQIICAGDINFVEAVHRNLEISQLSPESLSFMREHYSGGCDLERSANQVVAHVAASKDPSVIELSKLFACEAATISWE
jgi:hypothetical protein